MRFPVLLDGIYNFVLFFPFQNMFSISCRKCCYLVFSWNWPRRTRKFNWDKCWIEIDSRVFMMVTLVCGLRIMCASMCININSNRFFCWGISLSNTEYMANILISHITYDSFIAEQLFWHTSRFNVIVELAHSVHWSVITWDSR